MRNLPKDRSIAINGFCVSYATCQGRYIERTT